MRVNTWGLNLSNQECFLFHAILELQSVEADVVVQIPMTRLKLSSKRLVLSVVRVTSRCADEAGALSMHVSYNCEENSTCEI